MLSAALPIYELGPLCVRISLELLSLLHFIHCSYSVDKLLHYISNYIIDSITSTALSLVFSAAPA